MNKTYPDDSIHNSEQGAQDGLTKREYFAAMAMQGLLARTRSHGVELGDLESRRISAESVLMADLLVKELNEETIEWE